MISVSVWSDIACPWCFVGKAHLDEAISQFKADVPNVNVNVKWRAFELDPSPRKPSSKSYAERLAAKYQRTLEQAQEMLDIMTNAISEAGGFADFNRVIAANTFNAHRLIQWAGDSDDTGTTLNAQHQLTDALMRGYLGEGLDLNNHESMLQVVATTGLSVEDGKDVLTSRRYSDTVRADEQEAHRHGISGVPFFVIGGYGLSGAQPVSTLAEVMHKAQTAQESGSS